MYRRTIVVCVAGLALLTPVGCKDRSPGVPPECGNGLCEAGEDPSNCPEDCPHGFCGNNICELGENPDNCPEDCSDPTCGNGFCDVGEDENTCPEDCAADTCGDGVCDLDETSLTCPEDCPPTRAADLLFVVDNSWDMPELAEKFWTTMGTLADRLTNLPNAAADVHIGVITTDLGAGPHDNIRFCYLIGGDDGVIGRADGVDLGETCVGAGQRYIADVGPQGCSIQRTGDGRCTYHDCAQQHCDLVQGGTESLTLSEDNLTGCPRCRNYQDQMHQAFACLADVGTNGCGFEQPLEAMFRALDNKPENDGFLRADSLLVVVFLTEEDDCSASQPDVLFDKDPDLNTADSRLGYLHSFRCFEFGIVCDVNGRELGPRQDCRPRPPGDPDSLLHPINRYTSFLTALRDPGRMVVAAVAAPFDGQVVVMLDSQRRTQVQPTCNYIENGWYGHTVPSIRLKDFVSRLNSPEDVDSWAFSSVCAEDYSPDMVAIGDVISERLAQLSL